MFQPLFFIAIVMDDMGYRNFRAGNKNIFFCHGFECEILCCYISALCIFLEYGEKSREIFHAFLKNSLNQGVFFRNFG